MSEKEKGERCRKANHQHKPPRDSWQAGDHRTAPHRAHCLESWNDPGTGGRHGGLLGERAITAVRRAPRAVNAVGTQGYTARAGTT